MWRLVLAVMLALLAVPAPPASACSCAELIDPPYAELDQAGAGVVGTIVALSDDALTLQVETSLKEDLGARVLVGGAGDSAGCGIGGYIGLRTAFLLSRDESGWQSSLCGQVDPSAMLAAAELPPVDGQGPIVAVTGGAFGSAQSAALDGAGRVLAYGVGDRPLHGTVDCGRPDVVLEVLDVLGEGERATIQVRDLTTFTVEREIHLPYSRSLLSGLYCTGEDVLVFLRSYEPPTAAVTRVERYAPEGSSIMVEGLLWQMLLVADRPYLVTGPHGDQLSALDPGTGALTVVRDLPAGVNLRPAYDGTLIGVTGDPDPHNAPDLPQRLVRLPLDGTPMVQAPLPGAAGTPASLTPLRDGGVLVSLLPNPMVSQRFLHFSPELTLLRDWEQQPAGIAVLGQDLNGSILGQGHSDGTQRWFRLDDLRTHDFEPQPTALPPGFDTSLLLLDDPVPLVSVPATPAALALYRPAASSDPPPEPEPALYVSLSRSALKVLHNLSHSLWRCSAAGILHTGVRVAEGRRGGWASCGQQWTGSSPRTSPTWTTPPSAPPSWS